MDEDEEGGERSWEGTGLEAEDPMRLV